MTKLEELIREKKKIERQIAEIKQANMSVDGAMIYHETLYRDSVWCLRVRTEFDKRYDMPGSREERFYSLVKSRDRQYVISAIDTLIGKLTELKEKMNNQICEQQIEELKIALDGKEED